MTDRENTNPRSVFYAHCFSVMDVRTMNFENGGKMNKSCIRPWIISLLIISMAACTYPGRPTEIKLEPEEIGSADEEEIGSIVITLVHSLDAGLTFVKCNTTETIWLQFFKNLPGHVSKF